MMKSKWLAAGLVCVAVLAFAAPKGTVARSTALNYPAHTEQDGVAMGAVLLTSQEARSNFVSDLNHCCLVVEVALYPEKGQNLDVSLNHFSLRTIGTDSAVKAGSAKLISATLQKKAAASRDVVVSPSAGVGYESGAVYDPITGQPRHGGGIYTQTGVGVGIGSPGGQGGGTEADRSLQGLTAAVGFIRREVAESLHLRRPPELHFHLDRSDKYGARIDELLGRTKKRKK